MRKIIVKENDVVNAIFKYISIAYPQVRIWQNKTTGVYSEAKGCYLMPRSRFFLRGVSDILGIIKGGRFLAIEVKSPNRKNNLSEDQKAFLDMINRMGGLAFVASSIDDVRERINAIL